MIFSLAKKIFFDLAERRETGHGIIAGSSEK